MLYIMSAETDNNRIHTNIGERRAYLRYYRLIYDIIQN